MNSRANGLLNSRRFLHRPAQQDFQRDSFAPEGQLTIARRFQRRDRAKLDGPSPLGTAESSLTLFRAIRSPMPAYTTYAEDFVASCTASRK